MGKDKVYSPTVYDLWREQPVAESRVGRFSHSYFHDLFHQFGERIGLHFLHDFASPILHSTVTDAKLRGHGFVRHSGGDELQNVVFAG